MKRQFPNPRPAQLPSALKPVLEKLPRSPHTPLGQIRNNLPVWGEPFWVPVLGSQVKYKIPGLTVSYDVFL